jgi:hypothetical protein
MERTLVDAVYWTVVLEPFITILPYGKAVYPEKSAGCGHDLQCLWTKEVPSLWETSVAAERRPRGSRFRSDEVHVKMRMLKAQ